MRKYLPVLFLVLLLLFGANDSEPARQTAANETRPITVTTPFNPQYPSNHQPQSSLDNIGRLIHLEQFSRAWHTNGAGVKIALIDSGIDVGHAAFQRNADGTAKIACFYDLTGEGSLESQAASRYDDKIAVSGNIYYIGDIPNKQEQYRLAMLSLNDIQPEKFPATDQQIAILITALSDRYDCVYLDTNQNYDFTDETPLTFYNLDQQYITLHTAEYQFNLALTALANDGTSLQLSADTLGHGTFLAGIIAANGAEYHGLAPQSQMFAYKIFDREGCSSQQMLAKAIEQAVADGVDVINLSLSIPNTESVLPRLSQAIANAEAQQIPIIAAAGNYGPASGHTAYPANQDSVIGVGSYLEPSMLALDQALVLEQPFIASYSSRGQIGEQDYPTIVAPAGAISTVPSWYREDYLYDQGTSISAAVTTAAAAHILQYLNDHKQNLLPRDLKHAFANTAVDLSFPALEQGYGAVNMQKMTTALNEKTPPSEQDTSVEILEIKDQESFHFAIPQGQTMTYYVQVPAKIRSISAAVLVDQQEPRNDKEHLVAMGRCQIRLFNPQAQLEDETPFIGASFSQTILTTAKVSAKDPRAGIWQITITSDEKLSQYNHFETTGSLTITVK